MFIAVDLKVIEGLSDAAARAAGVSGDRVLAGLVRLWHRCWVDEADTLTRAEIGGVLGLDSLAPLLRSLVVFGFLEMARKGSYRVKGGKRYIRLKESRRRGAEKTNAQRRSRAVVERRSRALASDARATLKDALSVFGGSADHELAQGEEDAF